ncbi:DUF2489 domain-containing protein [Salinimonas iocasae]|uniref:DUF2489 domain-containing protein n=1 Tax=Salinimonas iocasae TaxID=2572577 RepID=A0A5B7Y9G6_9ALTE|nr:DUF2489 domain-containing protein [Salinimonas iocasae]QCZ91966.1 DUF2489 domain-containing protein [Salinimonas iocasae]
MVWAIAAAIGVLIILALGIYAGRLLFMLKQQNTRQTAAREKRTETITDSIILIAKAMEQQQCELSEGAIRICNLLEALPLRSPPTFKTKFPHIYALFIDVSGFAILEERQKLSPKEKMKQDKAREQIESEHETKVLAELPDIRQYCESLTA